jgi:hypothetical protein
MRKWLHRPFLSKPDASLVLAFPLAQSFWWVAHNQEVKISQFREATVLRIKTHD